MTSIDATIVEQLRNAVREGCSASCALKSLQELLPNGDCNTIAMIRYAREAFCLSLAEASPIAGWVGNGEREIPDDQLDELLIPAIATHRGEWDKAEENQQPTDN